MKKLFFVFAIFASFLFAASVLAQSPERLSLLYEESFVDPDMGDDYFEWEDYAYDTFYSSFNGGMLSMGNLSNFMFDFADFTDPWDPDNPAYASVPVGNYYTVDILIYEPFADSFDPLGTSYSIGDDAMDYSNLYTVKATGYQNNGVVTFPMGTYDNVSYQSCTIKFDLAAGDGWFDAFDNPVSAGVMSNAYTGATLTLEHSGLGDKPFDDPELSEIELAEYSSTYLTNVSVYYKQPIPEPATCAYGAMGLMSLIALRRKIRK